MCVSLNKNDCLNRKPAWPRVDVECIFTWYWVADFCAERGIDFALGHAYYMKSIHGGKTKSDKIDSEKIANMLRGGMFPIAYAYPKAKRAVRDLLRRRLFFVRQRAELSVHLQNTNHHTSLRAVCMRRNYLSRRSRGLRITEADTAGLLKNENYMRLRPPLILSVPDAVTSWALNRHCHCAFLYSVFVENK